MKLSKKGEYSVRAMLDMAMQEGSQPVLLKDIARRQQISERFLEHVLAGLRNGGLVQSTRGARGGFVLARRSEEITLLDILRASVGDLCWTRCVHDPKVCSRTSFCAARDVWAEFGQVIEERAGRLSLAQLADLQRDKLMVGTPTYEI